MALAAVALGEVAIGQRVAADRERVAARELPLDDRVVRARAGDADREQHDRGVDDVSAVASPVPPDEAAEGRRDALARERAPRGRPADELEADRREHERREGVRDQPGDRRAGAEQDQDGTGRERDPGGPGEDAREPAQRGAAPGDERPDPHQQEQRQPEDAQEEVVVGPPDDDRLAAHGLGEDRPCGAPEDRQAQRDEQQVVVEERRLPRDERLEPRRRAELRQPQPDHRRPRRRPRRR